MILMTRIDYLIYLKISIQMRLDLFKLLFAKLEYMSFNSEKCSLNRATSSLSICIDDMVERFIWKV